jgi:hypothetical protein
MVQLSAAHGWEHETEHGRAFLLFRALLLLISECLPTIGLILLPLLLRYLLLPHGDGIAGRRKVRWLAWIRDNPWIMFPFAAVLLIPSSLLGFLKVGGYVNNFSLTHVFLVLVVSAVWIRLYAQIRSVINTNGSLPIASGISPKTIRAIVLAALALLVLWEWPDVLLKPRRAASMYPSIAEPWQNQQEVIYDFDKANPGLVYFPWNTLSMLLAEKRLYHFEWGIHDRYAAGITPTPAQINQHLPPRTRYIAYGPFHQGEETSALWFGTWTQPVADPRLKDFTIYTQPVPAREAPSPSSSFDLRSPPPGSSR